MSQRPSFTHCATYMDAQSRSATSPSGRKIQTRLPFVTLSREMGAGAVTLGEETAAYLQSRARATDAPWTVFDRNLMKKVLEEHHLPTNLAAFLPEDRVSEIQSAIRELFGLHPPLATMFQQMTKTILGLAEMGHVVLVGRGANLITAHLEGGFHVRLVGSPERRIERVMVHYQLSRKEAAGFMKKGDAARKAFVKKFFDAEPSDPLHYHLVVNTDRIPTSEAAQLIGEIVLARAAHA